MLTNAFEAGTDEIRFTAVVRGGVDLRVYHEANATFPGEMNTVLQIDQNGVGFGGLTPDANHSYLTLLGADLSPHHGDLLP